MIKKRPSFSPPPKRRFKKIPSRKRSRSSFIKSVYKVFFILSIWMLCFVGLAVFWYSYDLPEVARLQAPSRNPGITILTQDGKTIGTYGDLYEEMVKVDNLPPYVPNAFLAIEDRRFYNHFGVDFIGLFRAAYTNFQADRVRQGGSSITQQLAKNFLISQGLYTPTDRSIRRKIQEVIMALWLEWTFSKKEILTIYLNRVYFGGGTFGIDAASRKFFNKSAKRLTVFEAAVLAGLLKAPSRYSPIYHPQRAYTRASLVLKQMKEAGYISSVEPHLQEITPDLLSSSLRESQNSHYFADWVYESIPNYVNMGDKDLIVMTTMDSDLQKYAEESVLEQLEENGTKFKVTQGALVCMTPDGGVKAMVGGRNYGQSQFNRALAPRQSGSAFKGMVYLAAFEAGLTPDDLVDDSPISFGKWRPKNYKWKPRGLMTLQDSFAFSVNTASIRLTNYAGIKKVHSVAKRLGISTNLPDNLTIALGTAETTLLDLTSTYATFVNQGHSVWPYAIEEIRDKFGNILYQRKANYGDRPIVSERNVQYMLRIMGAATRYGYGRGGNFGHPFVGKTGSNQDRDAWFVGANLDYTVGVWFGNDNNAPMIKISTGGRLPAWTFSKFMKKVFAETSPKPFIIPEGGASVDTQKTVSETPDLTLSPNQGFIDSEGVYSPKKSGSPSNANNVDDLLQKLNVE